MKNGRSAIYWFTGLAFSVCLLDSQLVQAEPSQNGGQSNGVVRNGHGTEIGNAIGSGILNPKGSFSLSIPDGWSARSQGSRTEVTPPLGSGAGYRMVVQEIADPSRVEKMREEHQNEEWQRSFVEGANRFQRISYVDGREIRDIHIERSKDRWVWVRLEWQRQEGDLLAEHLKASARSLRWETPIAREAGGPATDEAAKVHHDVEASAGGQ